MPLAAMALFMAFGVGGSLSTVLLSTRRPRPLWQHVPLALAPMGIYLPAVLGMPFGSVLIEILVVAAGACALAGPMSLFLRLANQDKARREALVAAGTAPKSNILGAVAVGLTLPLVAIVLSSLLTRLNYAERLGWSCDGPIVERTRASSNHNAPTLVVRTGEKLGRFEMVPDDLWEQAKVGQHLTKVAGSPWATLDGARIRMVRLDVNWWHDPP